MGLSKLGRLVHDLPQLTFRLRQEFRNIQLTALPPRLPDHWSPAALPLPDGAVTARALAGTAYSSDIARLAALVRAHQFPALGVSFDTGPGIAWRRDWLSGIETGLSYFRRLDYLDASRCGDHKAVWELNRHQHLVVLAQDWLLHGDQASLKEISVQLDSWLEQNPFHRGINWASALEVAFRSLSWLWVLHFAGAALEPSLRQRCQRALYLHGHHLAANLSFYFSPNTHLLGEAVALSALGRYFAHAREGTRWQWQGDSVVAAELFRQTRPDGSHFEQSTYYHVYALDMFLFHARLKQPTAQAAERIDRMADFLAHTLGPAGRIPYFGDDDGGRFFHPYGDHATYGRATLATAGLTVDSAAGDACAPHQQSAWWGGPVRTPRLIQLGSRCFQDSGLIVLIAGDAHIVFDAGPFGAAPGGHSHADTLSVTVSGKTGEILIDPGTYCYHDPALRDAFRRTQAHNTLWVEGRPQAQPAGPFSWSSRPSIRLELCRFGDDQDQAQAACRFGGLTHRRRLVFLKPHFLLIFDELTAADGNGESFLVEQRWHLASEAAGDLLRSTGRLQQATAWRSTALRQRQTIPMHFVRHQGALPCRFLTAVRLDDSVEWTSLPNSLWTSSEFSLEAAVSDPESLPPWRS
jgi:hypothetical protein